MKTYKVRDERGKEIEIEEPQILNHLREPFMAILSEMGYTPQSVAAYDGSVAHLVRLIVNHIREQGCKLETARKEFRKLKDQRDADYQTILHYIRQQTSSPIGAEVIPIHREQKAA